MNALYQDIHYGLRMLIKYPIFTFIMVVTPALGIGASTATFSVTEWLCLRPMPFAQPQRVSRLFASTERAPWGNFRYADYRLIREQMSSLSGLAAAERRGTTVPGEPWSKDVTVGVVSRNFFSVLGVKAYRGLVFAEGDAPDLKNQLTLVISHRLWRTLFGGDSDLPGRSLRLDGRSFLILGIAPPGFNGIERGTPVDMWYPVETPGSPWGNQPSEARTFRLVGRLAPGVSVRQAQQEAEVIFARLGLKDPATQVRQKPTVILDQDYHRSRAAAAECLCLMAIALLVLVIACANVSGLLLARAQVRSKEMALRQTLGGTRARLIRQSLTEGCLLSLASLAVGLLMAAWLLRVFRALLPQASAPLFGACLNMPVVGLSVGLSLLTTLAFGLLPGLYASKADLAPILKADAVHAPPTGHALRGLNTLVAGQLAIALVLVATTGLLLRSYLNCREADLGFERKNILITELSPTGDTPVCQAFYRELMLRIKTMPGVKDAAVTLSTPFIGMHSGWTYQVSLPGESGTYAVTYNLVGPGYFRLLGVPLLRGRGFEDQDGLSGGKVVVINETMARHFWPGQDPLGQFVELDGDQAQVVGVVRDGRYQSLTAPVESYMYIPLTQQFFYNLFLLVETEGNPQTLERPLSEVIRRLDRAMDLYPPQTLTGCIGSALYERRMTMQLAGALGLLGVALASAGLYGVTAFAVSRRTQEFGIRMALGAGRRDVLGLVMHRGLKLALYGIGFGLMGALMAGRLIRTSLYHVASWDPLTLALSALALLGVTLLACYLPAHRAARIDPMAALRRA